MLRGGRPEVKRRLEWEIGFADTIDLPKSFPCFKMRAVGRTQGAIVRILLYVHLAIQRELGSRITVKPAT
jgi:hypothetical protein